METGDSPVDQSYPLEHGEAESSTEWVDGKDTWSCFCEAGHGGHAASGVTSSSRSFRTTRILRSRVALRFCFSKLASKPTARFLTAIRASNDTPLYRSQAGVSRMNSYIST